MASQFLSFFQHCNYAIYIINVLNCITSPAIPAILNAYSVKLTLQISAIITFVKFIATAFIVALGVYHIATG